MNTEKVRIIILLFVLIASSVASCTKDNNGKPNKCIGFSVSGKLPEPQSKAVGNYVGFVGVTAMNCTSKAEAPTLYLQTYSSDYQEDINTDALTKGSILNKESFKARYQSDGFGLFAYKGNALKMGGYSVGGKVTYNTADGFWSGNADFSDWGSDKMSFYAYAPLTASEGMSMVVNENNGNPTISYTTPLEVAKQIDLLVAKNTGLERPSDNIVPLTFTPALTAIVFRLSPAFKDGKLVSIAFKNIKSSGTFDLASQTWLSTSGSGNYTLQINRAYTAEDASKRASINSDNEVMFMIPQSFQDEAPIIEIQYAESANLEKVYTFTAPLKASINAWQRGKQITYAIAPNMESGSDIVDKFEVGDMPEITYAGVYGAIIPITNQQIDMQTGAIIKDKIPWSVEYSMDEGVTYSKTAPEWLSIARDEATGNAILTVQPQALTTTVSATGNAKWDQEQGTSFSPYNLANATGYAIVENTANCYIVNGPGWYKLPLVYGNAIKNGQPNPAAYTSNRGTFVEHTGNTVVQPYIAKSYAVATSGIIWQDVKDLVTDMSIEGTGETCFLKFRIAPETFDYGNAVIAVKDASDNVMWSWHIWTTGYQAGDGDINGFMPYNLGWVAEKTVGNITESYAARSCKVRFKAQFEESGVIRMADKMAYQAPNDTIRAVKYGVGQNNNVYYQWGRKDPFPGCEGSYTNIDKVVYGSGWSVAFNQTGYSEAIKNPGVFYASGRHWSMATFYYDLWQFGTSDQGDAYRHNAKTIYDPAPVGYCVPNSYTIAILRESLSFGALGYRSCDSGKLSGVNSTGYYWVSCPNNGEAAYCFYLSSTFSLGYSSQLCAGGYSIRAAKELADDGNKNSVDVDDYDKGNPYLPGLGL